MSYKNLRKKTEGFTIIEVLIVLAIAGLIMLIVFLAVPALQRNNRTTQRTNDASKILAAVGECLSNRNGQVNSCNTDTLIAPYLDRSKLQQLTEAPTAAQFTNAGQTTARTPAGQPIDNTFRVSFNTRCEDDGASATVVTNTRQYAIMFGVENTAGNTVVKCVQG